MRRCGGRNESKFFSFGQNDSDITMTAYYILFFLWSSFYIVLLPLQKKNRELYFLFFSGFSLFLLMALRDPSVGVDIPSYLNTYRQGSNNSYKNDELGFYIFRTLCFKIGLSSQQFLALISGFIVFSFGRLFYKYSKNIFVSFWLFMTIGLFTMSMSGLRQIIAISILLFAVDDILNRNILTFIMKVILATTFHQSAFIFSIAYFFPIITINKHSMILLTLGSIPFLVFGSTIINLLISLGKISYLDTYALGAYKTNPLVIIEDFFITLCCVFFIRNWNKEKARGNEQMFFLWMSFSNLYISMASLNIVIINRMGMYFSTANLILIPNIISTIKNKNIRLLGWIACLGLSLAHFIISIPGGTLRIDEYKFFFFK